MSSKHRKKPKNSILSPDKPILDPSDDMLGYSDFARYLANAITELTPDDGIVLGIYAPWGSGKTTLLNFIQHYLAENVKDSPIVVSFNPWWFSGQEDLVLSFFQQLLNVLKKDNRVGKKTHQAIEKYAEFIGQGVGAVVSLVGAAHGVPVLPNAGGTVTSGLKTFAYSEKSVNDLRADVENALQRSDTRLLIIIDDIDRLTAEEIRQLFRVVKAVADFPNIIYLLTFDRAVVSEALGKVQEGDGNDYLEKIIQVPFDLPVPDGTAIGRMLFRRLDVILGLDSEGKKDAIFSALFDNEYWGSIYRQGIAHFLNTPRDVVRFANTLSVTYPSVRNEVNPVDFIAIECLRVFAPVVYNVIQRRPEMFVGGGTVPDYEKIQYKKFHEEWFEKLELSDQQEIKNIVSRLFPRTKVAWNDKGISVDDASSWGARLRIAHQSFFPIFFRLTIPENEISNLKMHASIERAKDVADFTKMLLDLQKTLQPDNSSAARHFLERLQDYTQELIPVALVASVLEAVIDAADSLTANEPQAKRSAFDFGIASTIQRVIYQLLQRLSENTRLEVFLGIIAVTDSYCTMIQSLVIYEQEHGKFDGKEKSYNQTFTLEQLEKLEQEILKNLQSSISIEHFESGSLNLRMVLSVWQKLSSEEQVKQWLTDIAETEGGLSKVLAAFLWQDGRLDPFWLQPYMNVSSLRFRVENLLSIDSLSPRHRLAALEFLQEYADRDAGIDPDSYLYSPGNTVFEQMKVDKFSLVKESQKNVQSPLNLNP